MPKVKWGDGVSAQGIADAKTEGFTPYEGPEPIGVFNVVIEKAERAHGQESGNPMISFRFRVEGMTGDKKQFNGAPIWDRMTVIASTQWKVSQFCAAIGVTPADFMERTVMDDKGQVTKIGKVSLVGTKLKMQTRRGKDQNGNVRAEFGTYFPKGDGAKADHDVDADEPKAATGKKGKKGKAAAEEEAPF